MIKKYILCVTTLQCNICPTITLTHGPSTAKWYSEMIWTRHTAKWFEPPYSEMIWTHRLFLRTCLGGGHLQKGTILYWVWRDGRCMVVSDKKFGVVSYVPVGGSGGILPQKMFCIFSPLGLKCEHFLKQIFGNTALHCALIDRIRSVKCICMVCLCK
jgi:hypothetical protein